MASILFFQTWLTGMKYVPDKLPTLGKAACNRRKIVFISSQYRHTLALEFSTTRYSIFCSILVDLFNGGGGGRLRQHWQLTPLLTRVWLGSRIGFLAREGHPSPPGVRFFCFLPFLPLLAVSPRISLCVVSPPRQPYAGIFFSFVLLCPCSSHFSFLSTRMLAL